MSNKYEIYSKVSSCFANQVYNLYLQERYGVNYCDKVDMDRIREINRLKNLFHFKTFLQGNTYLTNFNTYKNQCTDVCNIASIIEKINLL